MKKFIVYESEFNGVLPRMYSVDAKNLKDVLWSTELHKVVQSLGVAAAEKQNGKEYPYYTIFDVEEDKVVFGEVANYKSGGILNKKFTLKDIFK